MKASIRAEINRANSKRSTGPKTPEGKQRAAMNATTHGLTGNRLILQAHEHEAYNRLTKALKEDLQPKTEQERQLVQKLIDCHTRLNRIAALDGNILNFGLIQNETDADHDDALETIVAQCRSWIENADSFEKLGRYEARISRQLLQYTKEFERLQKDRRNREENEAWERDQAERERARQAEEEAEKSTEATETKPDKPKLASFCKTRSNPAAKVAKYAKERDQRPQPPEDLAA